MNTLHQALQKYWKYPAFRAPQEALIQSVLDGHDTFGLMPTGGGKSLCYQIPAVIKEGLVLVISPLIALMKDQVNQLQMRDIKAMEITGGIPIDTLSNLLDNAQFGGYKLLYLSPERLQNDWFVERLKALPIHLIAIDEAHCVSQWGHDFRPAYLKIAGLKTLFPKVPFLALTATATDRVKADIITQLRLHEPKIFTQSFARENIAYQVYTAPDKLHFTQKVLQKYPGPAILYVSNRRACAETANQLETLGISATFYHGGLSMVAKEKQMMDWMEEKKQVMVATNAFGMGIDKSNVRVVVHLNLPPNLENYYQEAGRAGRNGEKAYALLLANNSDKQQAEQQFLTVLPDKDFLVVVYKKLCSDLQIAYGEGLDQSFGFNLNRFCNKYQLPIMKTYHALQFLDRQGILTLSHEFSEQLTLQFCIPSKEVIRYTSLHPQDESIVVTLLRTHPGVYDLMTPVNCAVVARKSGATETQVLAVLHKMHNLGMITMNAKTNDAQITFNEVREDERTINRVSNYLTNQNHLKATQLQAVLEYAFENSECNSTFLLKYFGEHSTENCGHCSNCITRKKSKPILGDLPEALIMVLKNADYTSRELQELLSQPNEVLIFALQSLLEAERIRLLPNNKYSLRNHE
ncbi:RecQ family ATP-dependent DNA helicase [Flavobacterium sp.]|uniref:RecQ family ATP-dependent DNA helicase n=1 Tax=Flavobacterium sp. TaxID=239 RepID=UPI0026239B4D|nr:RecQ family ATP-dependent DNA helicase [Flavobacterium sp.]